MDAGPTQYTGCKYFGTGLGINGEGTIERTSAHEFGHTLFGQGHSDEPGNLMMQSINSGAGMNINMEQFSFGESTIDKINSGEITSNRQFYDL